MSTEFVVFHMTNTELFRNSTFADVKEYEIIRVSDGYQPVAVVTCGAIDDVFRLTNHIDEAWFENNEVEVIADMVRVPKRGGGDMLALRSTSVGDVVLNRETGEAYRYAMCGLTRINLVI